MQLTMDYEQEEDGRWLVEVLEMPGVLTYGQNPEEAKAKAQALALRVLADRLEHGETGGPDFGSLRGERLKISKDRLRISGK